MSPRTTRALLLLAAGLAGGIAFRVLALTVPQRLDVALGAAVVAVLVLALAQRGVIALPPQAPVLGAVYLLLVAALLWRDSPALFGLNLLALAGVLILLMPAARAPELRRAGVSDYVVAGAQAGLSCGFGALPLVVAEVGWSELPGGRRLGRLRSATAGAVLALPVMLVFGGLLHEADPVYGRLLDQAFRLDLGGAAEHAVAVGAGAWLFAGWLGGAFPATRPRALAWRPGAGVLSPLAVGTGVGLVALLLLSFVLVQSSYLFGGAAAREALGMSYSTYARRGFFELVTVTALSLPLLLLADWTLARDERRAVRRCRGLMIAVVALLFALLASALDRMRLYTAAYGLTELRLYTTAFMGWLALVLGWLAATALRGRRRRFAIGTPVSALLVLGALNLVNPDALIVRVNAGRPAAAGAEAGVDTNYLLTLSGDAVPALVAALPRLAPAERCRVRDALLVRWSAERGRWTLGWAAAGRALRATGETVPGGVPCGPAVGPG